MSFTDFLDLLGKTQWVITDGPIGGGRIRRAADITCCPYLFVRGIPGVHSRKDCDDDRQKVFDAADNLTGHDPVIRRRLLQACGLVPNG